MPCDRVGHAQLIVEREEVEKRVHRTCFRRLPSEQENRRSDCFTLFLGAVEQIVDAFGTGPEAWRGPWSSLHAGRRQRQACELDAGAKQAAAILRGPAA